MCTRSKILWLTLCLLSMLPVSALGQIDLNPTVPEGIGVLVHFKGANPMPGEAKLIAGSGIHWIRIDFYWDQTEQTKGQYDFSAYDRLLAALQPYGIRVIFTLDFGNKLYDNGLAPFTDAGRQAFAQWAGAGVHHFQGRGILWEMWNEPDDGFWRPKANVDDYIKLALAVGEAIRKSAPGEAYIGPATSGYVFPFIEACFKAGLLNYWSAITVHPYRERPPETAAADCQNLRNLIGKYAPRGKQIPIIVSEWTYRTDWPKWVTPENQPQLLARMMLTDLASGVPITIWYQWWGSLEGLVDGSYVEGQDPVYHRKPTYLAAQTMTSVLSGYRFDRPLPANPSDYLLQFRKGNQTSIAAWTTGNPHTVTVPVNGRFRVIGTAGEALPNLSSSGHGISITLTQAPQYLVPQ